MVGFLDYINNKYNIYLLLIYKQYFLIKIVSLKLFKVLILNIKLNKTVATKLIISKSLLNAVFMIEQNE
jgi:hypothetical protein